MTVPPARRELEHWRLQLKARLRRFRPSSEYWLGDVALVGLSADVYEMTGATLELTRSPYPRGGYAVVRAALEASYDIALLVAERERYNQYGARLRVVELTGVEHSRSRIHRGGKALGAARGAPAAIPVRAVVEGDAKLMRRRSLPQAALLLEALEVLEQLGPTKHWSGWQRAQVIRKLRALYPGIAGVDEASEGFWGLASMHSHPSPRIYRRKPGIEQPIAALYCPEASDRSAPVAMGTAAAHLTCFAFDRRLREWAADPP